MRLDGGVDVLPSAVEAAEFRQANRQSLLCLRELGWPQKVKRARAVNAQPVYQLINLAILLDCGSSGINRPSLCLGNSWQVIRQFCSAVKQIRLVAKVQKTLQLATSLLVGILHSHKQALILKVRGRAPRI